MFLKPFRIKSQTQLKGSEKKKLLADITQSFPSLDEEDISKIFPSKADVNLTKIFCNKGELIHVYQIQKEPLFFKFDKGGSNELLPTVYFLWQHPQLLKTFTTQSPVVSKLQQGADLMLPGIEVDGPITPTSYGKFEKGKLVAINTSDNACPFAIGNTAHSSMDMYMAARHGKGVITLHIYADHLWQMGSKSPIPILTNLNNSSVYISNGDKCADRINTEEINAEIANLAVDDVGEDSSQSQEESAQLSDAEIMDELFLHCFLKSWKTSAKKTEFPILTSNFYRLHMMPACPLGSNLDIKKSSFKKLSKFLSEMANKNLIEVKEFPKGIENITNINYAHELFKNFIFEENEAAAPIDTVAAVKIFSPPTLEELYQVSGTTVEFFRKNSHGKGDVLSRAEVRDIVTAYIMRNNLKRDDKVELDSILHKAVVGPKEGYKESLRWDEIFSRLLGKMSSAFRISRPGQVPIIRKGKLEPIELALAKRTGNKKVTLIYNAGVFGIDENELAHQVQVGVATSTCVGPAENRPQGTSQILIQGNQVTFVAKLLLETYNIPRKYIKGLELAQKKK